MDKKELKMQIEITLFCHFKRNLNAKEIRTKAYYANSV